MKNILNNQKVQLILSIIILIASFIISSLQGIFGFVLPFVILLFFILVILLIYYVISLPLLTALNNKQPHLENVYSLDEVKEHESVDSFKEIWVITSDLKMAVNKDQFNIIIKNNVARGIKYKFYIKNTNVAKARAKEILIAHNISDDMISFYFIEENIVFIDSNTDYDLFITQNPMDNHGFIGITINGARTYIRMPSDLFINLKDLLEKIEPANLNNI